MQKTAYDVLISDWSSDVCSSDLQTPVAAALKLIEPGRGDFLLESVEGGAVRGRYSLLGLAPDLVFRAAGDQAAINPRWLADRDAFAPCAAPKIGRASCWERVCQYV